MQPGQLVIQNFDELAAKGGALIAKAEQAQADLTATGVIANPESVWGGDAAAQYQRAYEEWQAGQTQMIQGLSGMGTFLQQAAAAFRSQNDEVLKALGLISS